MNKKNKIRISKLLHRMKSIIGSSVEGMGNDIGLREGGNWCIELPSRGSKKGMIMYPAKDLLIMKDREIFGALLHEIAHAKFSSSIDLSKIPDPVRAFAQMVNAVEDIRVERSLIYEYPGVFDSLSKLKIFSLKRFEKDHMKMLPEFQSVLLNLILEEWGVANVFPSKKAEKVFYDILKDAKEAVYCTNTIELFNKLEKTIWKKLQELLDDPPENSEEKKEKGKEGSGVPSGEGGSKEKPPENKMKKKFKELAKMSADLDSVMKELGDKSRNTESISMEDVGEDHPKTSLKPQKAERTIEEGSKHIRDSDFKTYEELFEEVRPKISVFARKLKSIIKDNKENRYGGRFRTGKLNHKILYKFKCNSGRLFSKKIIRGHEDYAVTLLIDESGSMAGEEKNVNAARSAVLLAEVIDKCNLPFAIMGFNNSFRVYKTFKEKFNWVHRRNMELIIPNTHTNSAGWNNDGYAVNFSSHELGKEDGERILIVVSDGLPASSGGRVENIYDKRRGIDSKEYTSFNLKEEVMNASKNSLVIGVGVDDNSVVKYYKNHAVLEGDVDRLPSLVINLLSKSIKRG